MVALAREPATTDTRGLAAALVLLTFAFPVIFAAVFFPTPAEDLREQINWGSSFPLHTWKHPPLQSWLPGVVALTSLRDAWPYVLVAQLLNFVGLLYAVRIAREFIDPQLGRPVAIAYCASIPISAEVLVSALNADQIQGPLWLAVLYHALRAAREDGWPDWIACGVYAGLTLLTKYFSAVFLVALALASVVQTPQLLRRPKPYAAAAVSLVLAAMYVVPALSDPSAARYVGELFGSSKPHGALSLVRFVASFVVYEIPLLLALAWLWGLGEVRRQRFPNDQGAPWVIVWTTLTLVLVLIGLLVVGQMKYYMRFTVPLLPLCILALFCIIHLRVDATQLFARVSLVIWTTGAMAGLVYALTNVDSPLREPAAEAAALIRADWERHYHCGPAYVLGDQLGAHAIGLYYGNSVIGVSPGDYRSARWVDQHLLADLGAVLVTTPGGTPTTVFAELGQPNSPTKLRLSYRRTLLRGEHVYEYQFVPPKAC